MNNNTVKTLLSWGIISAYTIIGFAVGYMIGENEKLRSQNKIMLSLMELQNMVFSAKTKNKEEATEKPEEEKTEE